MTDTRAINIYVDQAVASSEGFRLPEERFLRPPTPPAPCGPIRIRCAWAATCSAGRRARAPEQVGDLMAMVSVELTEEDLRRLDAASRRQPRQRIRCLFPRDC